MNFENQYNIKSPAVKRLMREASEMHEPTEDYSAAPVGDNLFEWHFTIRGASETDFEGGIYHGRLIFPSEYPMKPPNIILLTPNGRFETNKKVCLSISGHHPETWQPSWCVRTALLALIAFLPTPGNGTVGALDYSSDERKALAKKSLEWKCPECGKITDLLLNSDNGKDSAVKVDTKEVTDVTEPETKASGDNVFSHEPEPSTNSSPSSEENSNINYSNNIDNVSHSETPVSREPTGIAPPIPVNSLNDDLLSSMWSNITDSKLTVSVIVILIALLLYRRIFLLDYNE
ncbi:ubiquitin-conjugating enzyme E2 J1-like [Planococcus citri]|uniref:ubiquitin-conjugating enzyme E2 J1-like n=1 Tax=Planococcus citri TaxID=170843 RepID=UPI0031FA0553